MNEREKEIELWYGAYHHQQWPTMILGILFLAVAFVGGCATADVSPTQAAPAGLPKPDHIQVYDFAVTPAQVTLDSGISPQIMRESRGLPQTEEEIQVGQAVGTVMVTHLVQELRNQGIAAYRAAEAPPASATTASIQGQFLRIDQGDRTLRTLVGFGLGGSQVQTRIRMYQGGRLVAEGDTSTTSSLKPGMAVTLGAGAAAGTIVTTAAVSGVTTVASEALSATVEADAKRTAKEVANKVAGYYKRHGWIAP